jgi:hypothetical protein
LADYPPLDVKRWADMIQASLEVARVKEAPLTVLRIMALAGDILKQLGYKNPPITSFRLNNILSDMVYDLKPLESVCGTLPYSLEEGVRITVEWMRQHES